MGWFKKKVLGLEEAPILVKFGNGKYAVRRKYHGKPYEYLSLVSGSYWYRNPDEAGEYALSDEATARRFLDRLCLYHEKGTPA